MDSQVAMGSEPREAKATSLPSETKWEGSSLCWSRELSQAIL